MSRYSCVLVGYDGTPESELALIWALEEARLRELALTICHTWRWPYPIDHVDYEGVAIVKRMGENLLDHAMANARRMAPGVPVGTRLMDGPAHAALLHQSRDAALIVVGSHERDQLPVGSTALKLPARAQRPVVVVRDSRNTDGRIVVGVDCSAAADAALGFACEEAALRGWRLHAVYGCWEPSAVPSDELQLFNEPGDRLKEVYGARLDEAVAPWLAGYPQVEAQISLVTEPPRQAMFSAAQEADLVVVGDRGTGGLDPLLLGSTSGALLQHAPCSVAVVHAQAGAPASGSA